MDEDKATRFISSLVKSIQALCNGFVDFSTSIEVIGHIHLNIDRSVKLNYVLTEEVSKSVSEGSTVFSSHSYHSQAPPSVASKSANDSSNTSQKSRKDNDPLGLSALPREVPNTSKSDSHSHSSNRVNESSNSSHSFSRTSDEIVKQENNRSSCQQEDSANRRRKMGPISQRTPSPAAKRVRTNDYSLGAKTVIKEQSYEVIEIKEEPDDEPSVFFGNSGSGQDIQTPDFTNVVMESLDRVNQIEGSELGDGSGGDGMGGPQQPVFPVMFHQNEGMSGGPVPGPSSDPQSVASTSGVGYGAWDYSEARLTGRRQRTVMAANYPMKYQCDDDNLPLTVGQQHLHWTAEHCDQQNPFLTGNCEAEELERIRIRRERVKLRVRAHRARKRAALQEAQRAAAAATGLGEGDMII